MDIEDRLYFNGIDGETGEPLLPPQTIGDIAAAALGASVDIAAPAYIEWLNGQREVHFGFGGDARDLSETGWGVIFPESEAGRLEKALEPLLSYRRSQMAADCYHHFVYKTGETWETFLARYEISPGDADPKRGLPYYLLLVGSPTQIPYLFQFQLDLQYAVGRLHFDGEGAEAAYHQYAQYVVARETSTVPLPRSAALFGVRNDNDQATQLSASLLIEPLASALQIEWTDWRTEVFLAQEATKARLQQLLNGGQTPDLLFTASHGIGLPADHPELRSRQGALVCQRVLGETNEFTAADVPDDIDLKGVIVMHFACFSAGTPAEDELLRKRGRWQTVEPPFVASLPQKLLRQGALAVVGHVGVATSCSFDWPEMRGHYKNFLSVLKWLRKGYPIGHAMSTFNALYTELEIRYHNLRDNMQAVSAEPRTLSYIWTAKIDAFNYVVLGDPAVRIALA